MTPSKSRQRTPIKSNNETTTPIHLVTPMASLSANSCLNNAISPKLVSSNSIKDQQSSNVGILITESIAKIPSVGNFPSFLYYYIISSIL